MANEENDKKPIEGSPKKEFHPKRLSKKDMDFITNEIDAKIHAFIKEGKYKDVLMAMGNLGDYSLNNQIYILVQKPNARTVHGMRKWNQLERHVIPGEKSIKIFSPIIRKEMVEEKDADGKAVMGQDGKPLTKKEEVIRGFEQGYVFDISQTDGKELDAFKFDEKKVVEGKAKILQGLKNVAKANGYSISYATQEELGPGCYGLCNKSSKEIKILQGMSDLQEISTTVHECGHALAHTEYRKDFEGLTPMEKKEIKEYEAESIACVVCTYLGLDTQNFNFSYIAGWTDGDIDKFRKNLGLISKYAKTIIKGIDKEMFVGPAPKKEEKASPLAGIREVSPEAKIPTPLPGRSPTKEMEMG
jgi:hypothetical protein